MRLDKIKKMIADGKTQKAIDLLQEILKDKDTALFNQVLLLGNQYKDSQKKIDIGTSNETVDLNRINYSLLNLCDEAAQLPNIGEYAPEENPAKGNSPPSSELAMNPLLIFAIIVIFGIVTVLGIFFLGNSN